ncbi:hypothetical protein KEM52_000977 [Ascosphaera acerosa]|nr:hypothetical protein KEM52_000977 [Ascosphaera acerosa]
MLGGKYLRSKGPHDPLPAIPEGVLDDDEYMVVFRDSDMIAPEQQLDRRDESVAVPGRLCNSQQLDFNSNPNHPIYRHLDSSNSLLPHHLGGFSGMLHRRDDGLGEGLGSTNYSNTIGSTAGCPKTRKVALVGIALDCSYTASFNSTETARDNVISVVNAASHVYEKSFNITLGLRNLTVFPPDCPGQAPSTAAFNIGCDTDAGKKTDISGRLNLFSAWRGQQNDDNAYWTLMSDCSSGSEVGLSWLGQLCVTNAHGGSSDSSDGDGDGASKSDATKSSVSGANVVIKTSVEWQVFAHETGHTFGAIHDCDTSTCARGHAQKLQCCPATGQTCDARGRYIMNPSANADAVEFSPCTIGNVCSGMLHHAIKTDCLTSNRGIQTITHAQCGNGVVEDGEDCDCGGEEQCAGNRCCDPKTCKFKDNAVCDDSNEECCKDCQFASASTVCRPSTGPCDPEEKCTGDSPVCPKDEHSPDGEKCSGNGTITEGSGFVGTLRCASGQCTSRDQQCRLVMGSMLDGDQTTACDTSTCRITCTGPSQPSMFCAAVMQNYLDGTPCRGSGHCKNGRCQGATFGGEVKSWVSQHKNLVIGLAAGIGGFLVLAVITGIIKRCRSPPRPRNAQPMPPQQMSPMPMQMPMPPPPPPAQPPHGYSGSPSMAQHVPWQPGPPPGPPGAMPQQPQPMYYPPPSNPPPPRYA